MHIKLPHIDIFSFWIGILISSLFWWIFFIFRPVLVDLKRILHHIERPKKGNYPSLVLLEQEFRENILLKAQANHLASPIFALSEIIQTPRFLSAPLLNQFDFSTIDRDQVFSSIPYIPGWPELAGIYKIPTLGVEDLLASGLDFVIIGYPGMGKSVTLAYIASILAKKEMPRDIGGVLLPVYFHISEILLNEGKDTPLLPINKIVSNYSSFDNQTLVSEFVRKILAENQAIFLIDGLDELKPADFDQASNYIKLLKIMYPNLPIIITASPDYVDGLGSQNFFSITISAWSAEESHVFFDRWGDLWSEHISKQRTIDNKHVIDPTLLKAWINNNNLFLSPLELTLTLWGAYVGDLCGFQLPDILSAHIQRSVPIEYLGYPIETLSLKVIMSEALAVDEVQIDDWSPPNGVGQNTQLNAGEDFSSLVSPTRYTIPPREVSPNLVGRNKSSTGAVGMLNGKSTYRFSHPIFPAYLAGKFLPEKEISSLMKQPNWIGREMTIQMYIILGGPTLLVTDILSKLDPPLFTNLFSISRWIRFAPPSSSWIGSVKAALLSFIQEDIHPVGLRCQAVIALVSLGNDPQIAELFRKFHKSQNSNLQQLSALGSGALKDPKSIESLSQLTLSLNTHVRNSSCLALSIINSQESIDALSILLLKGDDTQRRTAAESLSINTSLGHSILREAASMNDLFVRRAATFGLSRIKEAWAVELLSQLQRDDPEWAVRSVAQDVIESQKKAFPASGRKISPATETPWIIAYAGKQGTGIVPNKAPVDLLLTILQSGLPEEKIASLPYLSTLPSTQVFQAVYKAFYTGEPDLREAALLTLKEMAASGIVLPNPKTVGF